MTLFEPMSRNPPVDRRSQWARFFAYAIASPRTRLIVVNTRITYEYRDGANYRFHHEVIVGGEMTPDLWRRIRSACEDQEFFIAHQVRLPEVFGFLPGPHIYSAEHRDTGYAYDEENDHCWHRFGEGADCWQLTADVRTDRRSVLQLVFDFERAAKTPWRVFDPALRFGL